MREIIEVLKWLIWRHRHPGVCGWRFDNRAIESDIPFYENCALTKGHPGSHQTVCIGGLWHNIPPPDYRSDRNSEG